MFSTCKNIIWRFMRDTSIYMSSLASVPILYGQEGVECSTKTKQLKEPTSGNSKKI